MVKTKDKCKHGMPINLTCVSCIADAILQRK